MILVRQPCVVAPHQVFTKVVRASRIDTFRVGRDRLPSTPDPPSARQFERILPEKEAETKMRFSAATVLATALGLFSVATAHTIQLKAHSRECFHEVLHKDDLMTVTFQVGDREFGGSGNLEIDFWVRLSGTVSDPRSCGLKWSRRALLPSETAKDREPQDDRKRKSMPNYKISFCILRRTCLLTYRELSRSRTP